MKILYRNWPRVVTLRGLYAILSDDGPKDEAHTKYGWWPARGYGFASFWSRFKPAWLVFTGRADALIWPEDED